MVSPMSLAALASLTRVSGPILVDRLNAGVNAGVFASLAETLGLTAAALAESLGLSARTLRNRARLTADETERAFRAYRVFTRAQAVLGSEEGARQWLRTPQRALGERTPLSLLVRDVGAHEVVNLLGAIEDGGYV